MSLDYRLVVDDDAATATFPGVDMSNGNKPIQVVADTRRRHDGLAKWQVGDLVALKVPGGKCWAGIGMERTHVPAAFRVFKVTKIYADGDLGVDQLLEWPVVGARK